MFLWLVVNGPWQRKLSLLLMTIESSMPVYSPPSHIFTCMGVVCYYKLDLNINSAETTLKILHDSILKWNIAAKLIVGSIIPISMTRKGLQTIIIIGGGGMGIREKKFWLPQVNGVENGHTCICLATGHLWPWGTHFRSVLKGVL